ncbi:MAG: TPM domain-containing protein [Hydrogenophaga sp.]|nr:TPM domain-containing protein [Hydrogenophaga sp.]
MGRLRRIWRHLWMNEVDTLRAVPDDMAERLRSRIAASERRHSGEIRICVEAVLSPGQAWQVDGDGAGRCQLIRDRALQWFGQLGIWDTEQNNGVLVYLLLADRAIEIVADRGLARLVPQGAWQAIVDRLASHLQDGEFETGLTQALEEVSALLVEHFPVAAGKSTPNELPDAIVRV